ncbi:uncharacterized protein C8Q71DRAFT_862252 [Rhodofomes roseus]|uniref:Uncharacterized protein n=1 Tax=Rhodofomes roseus TaxID=34475 RepID=A0A4Y9Z6H6_9APHY|nr:uncharacterized protein C8Q71DRAFT_862252 [Rhodofomes roseus]KAH9830805.1 hypothetical protein C8Q71DRAFT_862252 [Rhodofomes roseus]TFY69627.1 hypothetical protein EVJ58_g290 [Rhodofomes roseus]
MGRSAKFHKKPPKKPTSGGTATTISHPPPKSAASALTPQEQKKRVGLKAKAGKRRKDAEGPVLGGADYVDLMLGGRRKAMVEATRLPQED